MRGDIAATTAPDPFDATYGVDTSGFEGWRALQSGQASDAYNAGYLGVDADVAHASLARIVQPQDFTFADLGCGKGRALIVASEFAFKELVGVEINASLAEIAETNLARVQNVRRSQVICGDAGCFEFPSGAFVVFMFHPFETPVMAQVAQRLDETLRANPRQAIVIYVNAKLAPLFDALPSLERINSGPTDAAHATIWRSRQPAPALLDADSVGDR